MGVKSFVLLLLVSTVTNVWSHHHHHHHHRHGYYPEHRRENSNVDFVEQKSNFESERTTDATRSESLKKNEKYAETLDSKRSIPFSARRLEKMLEKAILQIITGDLGTADMLLLKSLNYTPEEVQAIRERELGRRKDEELRKMTESNRREFYGENLHENKANYNSMEFSASPRNDPDVSQNERKKNRYRERSFYDKDFDFDSYNRQAVIDYENTASTSELWSEPMNFDYEDEPGNSEKPDPSQNLHRSFDRAMEPHVIFKIPYDNSEFDSNSDEKSDRDALASLKGLKHRAPSTLRHSSAKNVANSFHASSLSTTSSSSSSASFAELTPLPIVYQRGNFKDIGSDRPENQSTFSTSTESPSESVIPEIVNNVTSNETSGTTDLANTTNDDNSSDTTGRKISDYEGLEWVEDDIYRVKPDFVDRLNNVDENDMSDSQEQRLGHLLEENENDTLEYQNEATDPARLVTANVNASVENASQANSPAYQQLMLARAEENVTSSFDSQTEKVIKEIKEKILHLTGRGTNTNQVHQERLTTFWPTCQIPRNTDSEAWMDPFSMNMHFQLNLTSDSYVVAARLRLYVLPQKNIATSVSEGFDEDEVDEKKIRISAYYYTKSLKKHRSKKRLMDSVVTPLTTAGTHLALDVRQGVSSNHGLVIQIEDQDGRPLKPALYLQQPPCGNHDLDRDQKAFQRIPALFFRACTRYVRIVGHKEVTYLNCRHKSRYQNSIDREPTEFISK